MVDATEGGGRASAWPMSSGLSVTQAPTRIAPSSFLRVTAVVILVVLILNIIAIQIVIHTSSPLFKIIAKALLVDQEQNIPTFLSFVLIGCNTVLLCVHAVGSVAARSAVRWHWCLMALIFAVMAFDEAASLHEKLNAVFKVIVPDVPALKFSWVVPGAAFVGLFALSMIPFMRSLAMPERWLMTLSGVMFVSGAIGFELIGSVLASGGAMGSSVYLYATTLEEALEMAGMALFGYALLRLLADPDGMVRLPSARI